MKIRILLATALLAIGAQAQTWNLDSTHATVGFAIKHLAVSTVKGSLERIDGKLTGDPKKPASLVPEVTIQAASVNTGNQKRDEHVRGADFFDVAKFPVITFKGEKTEVRGDKNVLVGTLTLHGVSKKVEIPYTVSGPVVDPWKNTRIGLEGDFTIKRSEYGITAYAGAVGEDVKIDLSIEFVLAAAPSAK